MIFTFYYLYYSQHSTTDEVAIVPLGAFVGMLIASNFLFLNTVVKGKDVCFYASKKYACLHYLLIFNSSLKPLLSI